MTVYELLKEDHKKAKKLLEFCYKGRLVFQRHALLFGCRI